MNRQTLKQLRAANSRFLALFLILLALGLPSPAFALRGLDVRENSTGLEELKNRLLKGQPISATRFEEDRSREETADMPASGLEERSGQKVFVHRFELSDSKEEALRIYRDFKDTVLREFLDRYPTKSAADDDAWRKALNVLYEGILNLVMHGEGGRVEIYRLKGGKKGRSAPWLMMKFIDQGSGIESPNVHYKESRDQQREWREYRAQQSGEYNKAYQEYMSLYDEPMPLGHDWEKTYSHHVAPTDRGMGFFILTKFPQKVVIESKGKRWIRGRRSGFTLDKRKSRVTRGTIITATFNSRKDPWRYGGAAGLEELTMEQRLNVMAEAMPGGQALAVQASVFGGRPGLKEFLSRLPQQAGLERIVFEGDEPADWGAALAGLTAERVVFLGERLAGELLRRILPEMEITVLSPGAGLEEVLLGLGISADLLGQINAAGVEQELASYSSA